MSDLAGRVALVTGASRGLGRAIALALVRSHAKVVVNFRSHSAEANQVEAEVRALGGESIVVQADVSTAREVDTLIRTSEARLGPIDILVNNAGIARAQSIDEVTEQDWDELIAVNLKSCFLVTQAALPGMRARKWGRIINMSSVAAQTGGVIGPHYAASKAGIHGLTHYYASRLAKEGITVNTIAPALIDTDMVRSNPNARADLIPVGRFGSVDEVADVVVMLAGNGYLTGQTINVNGGWYMG